MKKVFSLSAFTVIVMVMFMAAFIVTCMVVFSCFAEEDCPDFAEKGCPGKTFICPLGEEISISLCWNWDRLSCQICSSIADEVGSKCNHPNCTEEWTSRPNGCSAPGISEEMTEVFGDACYIHDLCYNSPGRPKLDCDNEFLSNMLEICSFPGVPGTMGGHACEAAARVAYHAVVEFGQDGYDKDQAWAKSHCDENPLPDYESPLPDACDGKDNDTDGDW